MFKKTTTSIATLVLFLLPMIAGAVTTVTVDSFAHCFDTGASSGKVLTFQLAPGRYVASMATNRMSCNFGSLSNGCLIDTVMVWGGGSGNQANWGISVKAPTVIDVSGTTNVTLNAFVVDSYCADNIGTTSLKFQKAQ